MIRTNLVNIPHEIMNRYKDVVVAADLMYINGITFFITISRNIKFGTIEMVRSKSTKVIMKSIIQINNAYSGRGFNITHLLMDGEFESIRGELATLKITLNTVGRGEHVPDIERYIRTVKERCRCMFHSLPFDMVPKKLIMEMAYSAVFWLNAFPTADGITNQYSPRAIIIGQHVDFNSHCALEFGTYSQVHEEHDNTMQARTTGAIALHPTGNVQGGYYFYSLTSGQRLNRNHWTALPMPNDVIDHIRRICRRENANPGLVFGDRDNIPVDDGIYEQDDNDDDDESWIPDPDDQETDDEFLVANENNDIAIVNDNKNELKNENNDEVNIEDVQDEIIPAVSDASFSSEDDESNAIQENAMDQAAADANLSIDDVPNEPLEPADADDEENERIEMEQRLDETMNARYGERSDRYKLRSRRPKDYSHLHTTLESIVMTQYNFNKGIKIFKEADEEAVIKELQQLHDRKVMMPGKAGSLSPKERIGSLPYLMFLKEKRTGQIKARGCADGRKQQEYTNKEDASSPTVAIESVIITSVIDAWEKRDVATVDVPGAFMHADMDEQVHMRLAGQMAELLVKLDPGLYRKYVQIENGKPALYVELRKALYGTLRAALLFWRLLSKQLMTWGFKISPYDWCVANKDIEGSQCTIIWHVDDLKITHCKPSIVTEIIAKLSSVFGKEAPLSINRGRVHEYLGMTLDFTKEKKLKIGMVEYIKTMLADLPPDMDGTAVTPAANHLFDVNGKDPVLLPEARSMFFHHNVAKLLFLCKRARPDIQTAVAFLTTRVKSPDEDDYKKLGCVMKYLRGTLDLELTLEGNSLNSIKWWADGAFAVHPNMRSHTGGVMTLGKGAVYATSTIQKLYTKSSTEAELVAVDDIMPQVLWTTYFLKSQGYTTDHATVYQDNKSAILLEKNGRASSSKRTRHINVRYLFIKDRIDKKEIVVEYCPTSIMMADFYTKPLQGSSRNGL